MPRATPLNQADKLGATVINHGGTLIDTVTNPLFWVIKKIQNLEIDEPKNLAHLPGIGEVLLDILGILRIPYQFFQRKGDQWASNVGKAAERISRAIFTPITFCRTGKALQQNISEKIVGRLAYAITYCAIQIFQIVPYLAIATISVGIYVMYNTAPVALMSLLLGSILNLQVFFLYRVSKGLEATNEILDNRLDIVTLMKNGYWNSIDWGKQKLKASVSWIPTGSGSAAPTPQGQKG